MYTCAFVQVYSQLPLQKLSGYTYEVEDFEPYPCLPVPVPEPEVNTAAARRSKRSLYFGPPDQKNDVYSIFKVENESFWLSVEEQAEDIDI